MSPFKTKLRTGFKKRHVTARKGPSAVHYLSKPVTFWIAVMSLFAFVSGNMMGQHGVYLFFNSIWAQYDDSLIVYQGTTSPIPLVPDPMQWAKYGGDQRYNTYSQAPKDILISYPSYIALEKLSSSDALRHRLYSQDFHDNHPGMDMTAPQGTPVVAVMNGYVTRVGSESNGFGNFVILSHPNSPDPRNPGKTTKLYTLYGHLDASVATVGSIVKKGDVIGTVGNTGDSSGFHLHYQMGYDEKQLWTKNNNLQTAFLNPMQYIQAQYAPVTVAVAHATQSSSSRMTLAQRAAARKQARGVVAIADTRIAIADVPVTVVTPVVSPVVSSAASGPAPASSSSVGSTVTPATPTVPSLISEVSLDVPFDFGAERQWQKIRITLRDEKGNAIKNPVLEKPLALRTAFGKADFRPSVLTAGHFKNGSAEVEILPIGQTTVVVELYPLNMLSKPIRYAGR